MVKATKRVPQPDSDHIHEFPWGKHNTLTPGVEVSLRGKRGRFRFQYYRAAQDELTFVGGPLNGQRDRFISVKPDALTRVHRDHKTLVNIQRGKKGMQ